jgi:GDPmannose 4,6-dehydratase
MNLANLSLTALTAQTAQTALIIGVTGQDGYYLTKLLLEKNYNVHGMIRRTSRNNTSHLNEFSALQLHYGDLCDETSMREIINAICPDEIYNLGAMSDVGVSFTQPMYTADVDGIGVLRLLNAIKSCMNISGHNIRLYQASTSELFGSSAPPQCETTQFMPRSPYAVAKLYGYHIIKNYREAYGMFACNGILFNHESPHRGHNFVTRKITLGVAQIVAGKQQCVVLGNLSSERDWGHARDYVHAMWLMLQADTPSDYVIATGTSHTIREFATAAFVHVGMNLRWEGSGVNEIGIDESGIIRVCCDKKYYRAAEVDALCGDATKARVELGWSPTTTFNEIVVEMQDSDLI